MSPNNKLQSSLISKEECLQIIKNDFKLQDKSYVNLQNFKIKKCSSDLLGFMGDYYKLELEAEINRKEKVQRSYFIKTLPLNNPFHRDECERKGYFVKESGIYENILPNIQKYALDSLYPKAYLTRNDIMVLEDFTLPEKRLKQLKLHEVYTEKHNKLFLKHLAQLHAASLAWEIREGVNMGQQFSHILQEVQLTPKNEWYVTGIKSIVFLAQQHPRYQYQEASDFINNKLFNILLNIEDFTKPSDKLHNVFCHRDSWDRNIFWELNADNELIACRIVDFQLTRYSPPAIDVLYFLYNSFESPQERTKLLKDLLQFYFNALKENLKRLELPENLITPEEFQQDCQRALLPVLTVRGICEPLMKLPEGWSQTMRQKEPETFDRYMNSDRSDMFARVAAEDPTYMDKVYLAIQELLEYFNLKPK
ncbi:uncharacterized protein ACRADG_005576 [Cochliomyia hominivorax]